MDLKWSFQHIHKIFNFCSEVKELLFVCKDHVKVGLKNFEIPHVKEIEYSICSCSFCNKKAEIKIFYSIPLPKGIVKKLKHF